MKKFWICLFAGGLAAGFPAKAQSIDEILHRIEQNNKELQATQQAAQAAKLETQTRNNLEDPSVEYSPFYRKGTTGMASSELIVSQGFDFPTLYAARRKAGARQAEAIDFQSQAFRQNLLLSAKNICLDLIRLNQQQELLKERQANANELLVLFEKRLSEGDANIIDVNKIKMERMNVQTEAAKNNAAHRTFLQQLLAMNGNLPLDFAETAYPDTQALPSFDAVYSEALAADATLLAGNAEMEAAKEEVNVNKQNWLPKFSVGYRRNTELSEKSNGFLIGGSLPLFSNRKKGKIARAQALSAQFKLDDARLKSEAALHSLYNEAKQLEEARQAYDLPLMKETISALKEAVKEGQLSIIDYYTEAGNIYLNMDAYQELENRYQKVLAEIYKYKL